MFKRSKRWLETALLRRTALQALGDLQASPDAVIAGQAILTGLAERKAICRHCLRAYKPVWHSFNEWFQVRAILMVADGELSPMLCEDCFTNTSAVYNPQATNVGTNNSGHANVVLKNLG